MTDAIGLETLDSPSSPISEAFRTLRMNLQYASLDKNLKTLLLTSSSSGEQTASICANLGVAFAQSEHQVIIVDCDLRRPALHNIFALKNELGLTNMMLDEESLAHPPLQDSTVPGLKILTSGDLPPRPADLLGSRRMETVLERLAELADIVILTAPPVIAVIDSVILATKVDGVLLLASAGQTKRESIQTAVDRLNKVNANILGAVLTNVTLDASVSSYYG